MSSVPLLGGIVKDCGPKQAVVVGHKHEHGHDAHGQMLGCDSKMHKPGECHGFEAKQKGKWTMIHEGDEWLNDEDKKENVARSLGIAAAAVFVVMVLEISVGFYSGSLALISDGAHQLSDLLLYSALLSTVLMSFRHATIASSFGSHRAEAVGAFGALLLQYFIAGLLFVEALNGLFETHKRVDGKAICLTACVALTTNLILLRVMPSSAHSHSHSHGTASAFDVAIAHVAVDLLQSGVCIFVGVIIWIDPRQTWLDSMSVFVYVVLVAASTVHQFRQLKDVLMEYAPPEVKSEEMYSELKRIKGVIDVHCFHVWMLAPGKIAMSAHFHIQDDLHEDVLHEAQIIVQHRYGIIHSTLQISEDEDLA
jgi:cation diffusion facilitator family transporter